FFHFVIEGLRGAAAGEGSSEVTFPELELFVKRQVSNFVRSRFDVRQMPEFRGESRGLATLLRSEALPHLQKGHRHLELGKPDQAIDAYTQAIKFNPLLAEAYASRGRALNQKGAQDDALLDADRALRLDPRQGLAYDVRAWAWLDKGKYDQ